MKYKFLLLLYLIATAGLKAQIIYSDTTQNPALELDEVVISANKVEETRKTIAQQIETITPKTIANSQAQTTADLLQQNQTVFVQKSQMGGGSAVIRGFEASRVLMVVDGIRMNNLIYRAGHLQNLITVDNNSLERIEVLYGPSSTIYGSDALGGVIHMITKKPIFAGLSETSVIKVNALTRYGSVNNEYTEHIDVNRGGKKLASVTSFTYSKFGDLMGGKNQNPFYDKSYGELPWYAGRENGEDVLLKNSDRYLQRRSGYWQYDLMQKLAYKQSEAITHTLNVQYSNSSNIPRYDRLTETAGLGMAYAEWYYGPQSRLLTAYDMNYCNTEAFFDNMHFGVNYQDIEESRYSRKFTSSNLSARIENVKVYGANLDFVKTLNQHQIRLGFEEQYNTLHSSAYRENINSHEHSALDTRYPDGENYMNNLAVYLSHTWKINETLVLNDGIRAGISTLHSEIKDTSIFHLPFTEANQTNKVYSGTLGIVHLPSDNLKLSALISTGFRVPNVDDLAKVFESSAGTLIVPNPDLKPEKTINYELGSTLIFNQHTRWENTVYYTHFYDAIVTSGFQYNGNDSVMYDGQMSRVLANQNKTKAFIYGFSSSVHSALTNHLTLAAGINYTYGRIKTDSTDYPLDHIPPFMANARMEYRFKKFAAEFFVNYNGWKKLKDYNLDGEDNQQYATPEGIPAWFTANIRASYQIHPMLKVQAGIDNIFDTQYRAFASGINAPGRNIFVALRFNY